ncbi:MAG: extracellular solute-binding protein [Oscillibacter sp.]
MLNRIFAGVLAALSLFCLTSCGKTGELQADVLTQTVVSPEKIPVTVLVKNAFTIHAFEKAAEEKFPNLDIIQVGNHTVDMGIAEYTARLKHDDLTDIVMTWPLDVGEEYWADRLLDLSSLAVSGKYTTAMLNNISRDGKLYYLPGPSQVRGIVYNKTLFAEKGWAVPTDFEGFLALCQTIEASGMRSLQLGLGNAEVLDTAFVGYSLADCFSKLEDAQWLKAYNQGEGHFADQFAPALDTFQRLIDEGILKKEDLSLTYADRENLLFTRRCAMVEDSVLMARMGEEKTGCTDQFALMPFFNPGENGDWARLYPVCYIGLNKHLAEEKNKEKYELILQLLEYISTEEGQIALSGDTGAVFSSLNGMAPPAVPEIADLVPALTGGRYFVFPTLKNAQNALRRGLAGMVAGTMTAADVARLVDAENRSPAVEKPPEVLGTASENFTRIETGNFVTDAMREETGCEIALFLDNGKDGKTNGKGISASFYQGELTETDLRRIYPDTRRGETGELWKVTMTGENLLRTLEYAIPVDHQQTGWFYYFSGLRMTYAPAGKPGQRIQEITDDRGVRIDPEQVYSIAVMEDSVPEDCLLSCEKTGVLIPQLLKETIQSEKTISPSEDGRFIIAEP